jgi:hypothetical protein
MSNLDNLNNLNKNFSNNVIAKNKTINSKIKLIIFNIFYFIKNKINCCRKNKYTNVIEEDDYTFLVNDKTIHGKLICKIYSKNNIINIPLIVKNTNDRYIQLNFKSSNNIIYNIIIDVEEKKYINIKNNLKYDILFDIILFNEIKNIDSIKSFI